MTPLDDSLADENTPVSWADMFSEGEKRINARFLDVMILTPPRDRARLLAQRDAVQRKIAHALETSNPAKLRRALKEQVKLLMLIAENKFTV